MGRMFAWFASRAKKRHNFTYRERIALHAAFGGVGDPHRVRSSERLGEEHHQEAEDQR